MLGSADALTYVLAAFAAAMLGSADA